MIDGRGELERRIERLEALLQRSALETRSADGVLRVRLGRQDDGAYGLRVWSAAGVLVIDETA